MVLDSPPPYTPTPLPPLWTRILNWLLPPLGVTVEDLRPATQYVKITLAAAHDIRLCEKIFDDWMTQLDKVATTKKPDKREKSLRFYLGCLKEEAGWCANATNAILRCHIQFASMMADRIDNAAKSQHKLEYDDSKTMNLAKDINEASLSLRTNVIKMKVSLDNFVSVLEGLQVTVKKERSLGEWIIGWLKYLVETLVKAIASIFATICPPISSLAHSTELKALSGISTLAKAATTFFALEPQEGNESEVLDSVILFLKEIVPREAQTAHDKLNRFDVALYTMEVDSRMRAGRRVTLQGPDPAAVAREWHDVAKQYQSVLPDDDEESAL